jgi:hypothetical protein
MALTTQDREFIQATITTAVTKLEQSVDRKIIDHGEDCPQVKKIKTLIVGVFLGALVVGATGGATAVTLIKTLL